MAAWNIYEANGRYVGKYVSRSPMVAFCEYMALYEPRPNEAELQHEPLENGTNRITYGTRVFIISDSTLIMDANAAG